MSRHVLVVARHDNVADRMVSLLRRHGFEPLSVQDDASALSAISATERVPLDVVLVGGVIEPASRARLLEAVHKQRPGVPVVEHFGGFHNLVKRVEEALAS